MLSDGEIRHKLTVKQVRDAKKIMGSLLTINERIKSASPQEMESISGEILQKTEEQDEYLYNTLVDCLTIPKEKIDDMEYLTAIVKFNELFTKSTQVEKKPELQSATL